MSAPTRAQQLIDVLLHAPRAMAKAGGLHRFGVLVLLAGAFVPIADSFIVNVAPPTIDRTLHASGPTLELIVAGYGTIAHALAAAIGVLLAIVVLRVLASRAWPSFPRQPTWSSPMPNPVAASAQARPEPMFAVTGCAFGRQR